MRLQGKRAVIVGGVRGIGREIVGKYLEEGAEVLLGDISDPEPGEAPQSDAFHFRNVDGTDEASVSAFFDQAGEIMSAVDILVLNLGILDPVKIEDATLEQWRRSFAINTDALFLCCKHALPLLRQSGKASIIVTASMAAWRGGPNMVPYSASKGAAVSFCYSLARELVSEGIRVNAVNPGWVDTPFNSGVIERMGGRDAFEETVSRVVPLGRAALPPDLAPLYVYLGSDESAYATAQSFHINGGVIS